MWLILKSTLVSFPRWIVQNPEIVPYRSKLQDKAMITNLPEPIHKECIRRTDFAYRKSLEHCPTCMFRPSCGRYEA